MTGGLGLGSVLPPASHPCVHKSWIPSKTLLRPETEALEHAGPERVDDHMCCIDQTHPEGALRRVLEIQGDGALTGVEIVELRVAKQSMRIRARPFDHNDVRSELGEHHATKRPWTHSRELQNAISRQRPDRHVN